MAHFLSAADAFGFSSMFHGVPAQLPIASLQVFSGAVLAKCRQSEGARN
jgi:hypothetical protein